MGVLINDMRMPKGCATCPYCDRVWSQPKCKAKSSQGRFLKVRLNLDRIRQEWCPLVELVQCKNCKYMEEHWNETENVPYWPCRQWDGCTDYDGFCHYGERKDT